MQIRWLNGLDSLLPMSSSKLCKWLVGEESTCQCRRYKRHGFDPWVGKIPWSRKWQPTPVFLPGEFHGQRNLVGYHPWDGKELDRNERLSTQAGRPLRAVHRRREQWEWKGGKEGRQNSAPNWILSCSFSESWARLNCSSVAKVPDLLQITCVGTGERQT